jgi:predicted metalloprotease
MTKIRSSDGGNVQDRRGQGGGGFSFPGLGRSGGGTGFPIPTKAGGGGLIGLLVIAAIFILPRLLGGGGGGPNLVTPSDAQDAGVAAEGGEATCQTEIEQILCGAFNDAQDYWVRAYPQAFGGQYEVTDMVWFSGGTETNCGTASSETGPFYCPADHFVYFDIDFLQQLQDQLGATGDLATQYIVAHEVGHHVQTLNGTNQQVQQASGEQQRLLGIALELQADCLAGAWVYDADRRRNDAGEDLIDADELVEAIEAAVAVGDDHIQMQMQGRVDTSTWTHGSSEQRESWFRRGYSTGDPTQCDTFAEI